MFYHEARLQYDAKPDRPDPVYAKNLQEILGGHMGEITVAMQYMFQGFNCRGPAKYRDMLLDTATEEWAHVEMIATMIARLLEGAPVEAQEQAVNENPAVAAVMGGINPQHIICAGMGALATDAAGNPWTANMMIASGNLLADFRDNLSKESHGRLQACRLYELTADKGVRDMLAFLIARDTMHQQQWMAACNELERDGLEFTPVPSSFPRELEKREVAYQIWDLSKPSLESGKGRWASGPSFDGHGEFEHVADPKPLGPEPALAPADPKVYGTNPTPAKAAARTNGRV